MEFFSHPQFCLACEELSIRLVPVATTVRSEHPANSERTLNVPDNATAIHNPISSQSGTHLIHTCGANPLHWKAVAGALEPTRREPLYSYSRSFDPYVQDDTADTIRRPFTEVGNQEADGDEGYVSVEVEDRGLSRTLVYTPPKIYIDLTHSPVVESPSLLQPHTHEMSPTDTSTSIQDGTEYSSSNPEEDDLILEEVRDKRMQGSQLQYKIKWKGQEEETWEDVLMWNLGSTLQSATRKKSRRVLNKPPSFFIDGEELFEVEEIVGSYVRNGKIQYKIRWLGYSDKEDTWVAAKHVSCDEKLAEYYRAHPNAA